MCGYLLQYKQLYSGFFEGEDNFCYNKRPAKWKKNQIYVLRLLHLFLWIFENNSNWVFYEFPVVVGTKVYTIYFSYYSAVLFIGSISLRLFDTQWDSK